MLALAADAQPATQPLPDVQLPELVPVHRIAADPLAGIPSARDADPARIAAQQRISAALTAVGSAFARLDAARAAEQARLSALVIQHQSSTVITEK
ncbi:MAG: hypothetical protein H0V44_14075 [Planctomycetes bacterium]|nr:hypothetical protein [Planctomycetota bacterium]